MHGMDRHGMQDCPFSAMLNVRAENIPYISGHADMMRSANIPEDVAISFENFVEIVEVNGQAVKSK